ncbi:CocE/NonD family hydrolase [Nocardioides marmoribigeumensis]|uniref:CocE/NonD family hydrolase n=1 Tax=Nocardioides marmoribigeumensis TaxID=433649 RepID=A0ABU2C1I2_9ACTN|nr:CocE/NonD family hydrolase [Nocardioides marmoribigeumensis]MDR7364538.1 putative CocE/NonD family hydrolase [Nocardioides marmoribigeumensis]
MPPRRLAAAVVSASAVTALAGLPALAPAAQAASSTAPASGWKARPATYGVASTKDVPVRMSDGTVLRADVLRPAKADGTPAPGRFPVIVTQTPYNKSAPGLSFENDYLVQRGYVQVIADVRGTGSSLGTWDSFGPREQLDGKEIVEWAHSSARPWSNGRVGLYGISYGAINQFFTAAQHPAGLRAMFPIVPAGDVYRDVVASGGQIDAGFIPLWLGLVTTAGLVPPAYTATDPAGGTAALLDHVVGATEFQGPTIGSAVTGDAQAYDGPFYRTRSPLRVVDRVTVPTFVVGGEYDLFQRGEPMLYERLRANGVPTRFLLGPWTHLQASSADLSGAHVGTMDELVLRWMDRHVRGVSDRALGSDVKQVTYHEIGGGWRTAPGWMPSSVSARTFQLSGTATPGTPGSLVAATPTSGADDVHPVPVAGLCTRSASQWTAGALAVPPCEDNALNDSVGTSWQTAPLASDLHLMGPINAQLFTSSSRPDAMLSVHIEDVAPDGHVERLTGGWQVLSHRALDLSRSRTLDGRLIQPYHPFTEATQVPMETGKVARIDVEVFPTGAVLRKGHRLRVTVQQYDVPHLLAPLPQVVDSLGSVVTIHHSRTYPSRLVLPVRG